MTVDQISIISVLVVTLILYALGKWRYDLVSIMALLAVTILGLVPAEQAFSGFGHPAVITVAAVLILSRGLTNSGLVDALANLIFKTGERYFVQLITLVIVVTVSSAFMNNIGALALFMPVAIRIARKHQRPPSLYLMPLAFGSLLGGLITVVGSAPNIIIATFRAEALGAEPFRMFDFAAVGGGVALVSLLFILIAGWRLLPVRKAGISKDEFFKMVDYITALEVTEESKYDQQTLSDIERVSEGNVVVLSHIRNEKNYPAPYLNNVILPGDRIIVAGETEHLKEVMDHFSFKLGASDSLDEAELSSDDIEIIETTVTGHSILIGKTARLIDMRRKYRLNLLGIAREGERIPNSPEQIEIKASDVLLLQGTPEVFSDVLPQIGCLPLAGREMRLDKQRRLIQGGAIFAAAIMLAALGILPVQIAFAGAALLMVLSKFLTLKELYDSIDWPIIILLGAIIPVSQALETTGSAQLIADFILQAAVLIPTWTTLMLLITTTLLLSNVVNNAAAALIMAPIALNIALGLGSSPDPFFMATAIGASCAFLTPVGHQSNILVMGPGGYRFGDYWRLGLPVSILVILTATPLIMLVWPL